MWLSGQHKRPIDCGEGQTGIVTVGDGETAVLLDSERRGLEVYAPAGYYWTPEVDQRVLVIRGQGEIPCVVGVRQDSERPDRVDICANVLSVMVDKDVSVQAGKNVDIYTKIVSVDGQDISVQAEESVDIHANAVSVSGQDVSVQAGENAVVAGQSVNLRGNVFINGVALETVVAQMVARMLGG